MSFIATIISAGLKWALSYFMPSKDEKLGKLEVQNADQAEVINDEHVSSEVDARIDNTPDDKLVRLSDRLNNRN